MKMLQHEFNIDCWCDPEIEEIVCGEYNDHTHRITNHHAEDGSPLFYTQDDDPLPYCADCGEALYNLMPDPDWLIAKGFISWRLMRDEVGYNSRSFGVSLGRPDDGEDNNDNDNEVRHVIFNFGHRSLAIDIEYRSRKKPADVQAQQMAPQLIDEIERHLRDHT